MKQAIGRVIRYLVAVGLTMLSTRTGSSQSVSPPIYQWRPGAFTWSQAKADAEARGGHLATITSDLKRQFIVGLGIIPSGSRFWLGATDAGHEGTWTWITGEPVDYAQWAGGEPNNAGGTENYLSGLAPDLDWNDENASTLHPYLLEIEDCSALPARATATVVNGFVVGVSLTQPGCGYTTPPAVMFLGPGGTGAAAYAQIAGSGVTNIPAGAVTNIVMTNAGSGYAADTVVYLPPPIYPVIDIARFSTNGPSARATPVIYYGFVVAAPVAAPGRDYSSPPVISFADVSGSGAAAYAQISNGSVTNIVMTSAGVGYSAGTVITIAAPPTVAAVVPAARQLMVGQTYQMQTTIDLTNWSVYGPNLVATTNSWVSTNYWNVDATNRTFFRIRYFP